jgi:hypothetical protein
MLGSGFGFGLVRVRAKDALCGLVQTFSRVRVVVVVGLGSKLRAGFGFGLVRVREKDALEP